MNSSIDKPKIGKDVIESLTLGMYEDCRFIYREYVQNAADAIDKAVRTSVLEKKVNAIHITIDPEKRTISIYDNGTGIEENNVMSLLRSIAHSTKKRGEDKGFRGIGRLGGLGYCSKLIFETSFHGEPVKSIMTWDADLLKSIINNRSDSEEAVDVLASVTKLETNNEASCEHYFRVVMEGVTSNDLLNVNAVTDYLSMVAPVDIASQFIFKSQIDKFAKENDFTIDTYNIFVNGSQIYKPYTSAIYDSNGKGKKKVDDITGVQFLLNKDVDGNTLYWGWYTISRLKGQMKQINIARGIRLRKENIQIGDEEICKKFFSKTDEQRFSFYYFGEIHAINKGLIPNSRRDYFGESKECSIFEQRIRQDFLKLKDLCYDAQKIRTWTSIITEDNELRAKIEDKEKKGYTTSKERDDLQQRLEENKKKVQKAFNNLEKVKQKISSSDSPLKQLIDNLSSQDTGILNQQPGSMTSAPNGKKTKFRTDGPQYSFFSKQERKLIGKIYTAIEEAIADERMREALINSIENQITK